MDEKRILIKKLVDSQFDYSLTPEEREEKKQQLKNLTQEIIQPQLKDNDVVSYGGVNFYKDKEKMKEAQRKFFETPAHVESVKPETTTVSKKEPLIIEPIKEEKEKPSTQEGFKFPNRNKLMKMEGEEEAPQSNSLLDKLLKKEREASPDVQVPRQVWNPELGTFEFSKDTVAKRPFSDRIFGSPEERAAEKAEEYSRLKQDDEERAKQVDSFGRRKISKNPLLESYEKLLEVKPEQNRQIASVSEAPVSDGSPVVPEIKSIKEQKSSPVSKSSVSTGVGEDDSPEAKLNEAIKAESEKAKKPEMDFNEMLRMAQEARDKGVLLGNIGKAAETFATGLTGTVKGGVVTKPVGTDFYDKLIKQAEQPVEDVGTAYTMKTKQDEMKRLARRRDPNSEESKFARDLLSEQGIKVPEAATAEALEKYAPQLTNILNQREARESRKQEFQIKMADIASRKDLSKDQKQETFIQSLRKETTSGALGKMFSNFNTTKKIAKALSEFEKNPSGYTDYATLLGGLKALQGDESVVREAEIKLGMNAASLGTKVKNWTDRLISGRSLQKEQIKEIINSVKILSDTARNQYKEAIQPIMNQADSLGIDAKKLVGEGLLDNSLVKEETPTKKVIRRGYNKTTNQTQLIYDDGTSEIVEGQK